jgi:hypothetical protein
MFKLILFKLSNDMAFRLNRTRLTSRDEFRTNQNVLFRDVTYLIYVTNYRYRRHCLFRGASLRASREDPKEILLFL